MVSFAFLSDVGDDNNRDRWVILLTLRFSGSSVPTHYSQESGELSFRTPIYTTLKKQPSCGEAHRWEREPHHAMKIQSRQSVKLEFETSILVYTGLIELENI